MYEAQRRLSRAGFLAGKGQARLGERGVVLSVHHDDDQADEVRRIVLAADGTAKAR